MIHYFQTAHRDGGVFAVATAHDTLEDAIEFAEAHDIKIVSEIGGNWVEYERCLFCGEWYTTDEFLHDNDPCKRCAVAIEAHMGGQAK